MGEAGGGWVEHAEPNPQSGVRCHLRQVQLVRAGSEISEPALAPRNALLNHRRPTSPAITELAALFSCVPFRRQCVSGGIQKLQKCIHPTCKVTDGQVATAWSSVMPLGSDEKPEYIRARINRIQFLDRSLEIGKALDSDRKSVG